MYDVKTYYFSSYVKHASLVNKVYPTHSGEEGPRASDLSYLVFYAQHRPEKLAKVGRYLYKRYSWDANKDHRAHHKVTLIIINSLLDACPTHLPYFARHVILILSDMADLGDANLLTHISASFIKFCSHYDASLDTDQVFSTIFLSLIDRFCACTVAPPISPINSELTHDVHQTMLAGLEAMKALAFSTFIFSSPISEKYTVKIIPPILANIHPRFVSNPTTPLCTSNYFRPLKNNNDSPHAEPNINNYNTSNDNHYPTKSNTSPNKSDDMASAAAKEDAEYIAFTNQRRLTIYDDLINDNELSLVALKALQKLARSASASVIEYVVLPVFTYLDKRELWTNIDYTSLVLRAMVSVSSTPVQSVILSQLLSRLNSGSFTSKSSVYTILPMINFGTPSLAIALTQILDALTQGINDKECDRPIHLAFVWLTTAFIPNTIREVLATIIPRISSSIQLTGVISSLNNQQNEQMIGLDTLEPLFSLLNRNDMTDELRHDIIHLISRASPPLLSSTLSTLACHVGILDIDIVSHHWSKYPMEVARLIQLYNKGIVPESHAIAALVSVRSYVPELSDLIIKIESSHSLSDVSIPTIITILNGTTLVTSDTRYTRTTTPSKQERNHGGITSLSSLSSSSSSSMSGLGNDEQQGSPHKQIAAPIPVPPPLHKQQSILRFGSMERKPTPEEFHDILHGKPVLERPISLGPGFQLPMDGEGLEEVLDKI